MDGLLKLLKPTMIQHSQMLTRVEEIVGLCLDEQTRQHCKVANIYAKKLVLLTDASAWRSRILYKSQILLDIVNRHGFVIEKIIIKVGIFPKNYNPPCRVHRYMTQKTKSLLLTCAENIDDKALSESLRRLAED